MEEKLFKIYDDIKSHIPSKPRLALVLGSGLGGFADSIDAEKIIPYEKIRDFPVSTAPGHAGRFIFGDINCGGGINIPAVVMQGRIHYYEGYHISDTVLPIRLMRLMGAEKLLLTNAVGSINTSFRPGDFMLICDHISSFVPNPLAGANFERLGVRFPDMSDVYSRTLREKIKAAKPHDVVMHEGVYVQTSGPSYESPAEIRMFRESGADVVGMSTVTEAIAARHCGFEVAGLSAVSNFGCGVTEEKLSHQDVLDMAEKIGPRFESLIKAAVKAIF
ncbi:purine nucleoside phosphorylase [Clostridia bacterium]|nr:purine nucleoside phosphorylase [Clostridia bacterium]